jgi:exosome complex RNA-binding protein Rrp42 (RNase PH superfamily)
MSLTLNSHRELCTVQKAGGIPISVDQIIECTRIAAVKVEEITETVQNALKKDAENRKKYDMVFGEY